MAEDTNDDPGASLPTYVHVAVGDHWVKAGRQYGDNYVALDADKKIVEPQQAMCVVCGQTATAKKCVTRDT